MEGRSRLVTLKESKDQNASWGNELKKKTKNNEFSKATLGQIFYGNCLLNEHINISFYLLFVLHLAWRN